MREICAYIRVSTDEQHKSGLGEEAQRDAIARFAEAYRIKVAAEYVEAASGAAPLAKRPRLVAAMADAKARKCPVVVARLDRLSRDVHFISGLMVNKVAFVVTTLGFDVDPFMLHVYAAFAEKERALISQRTKEALRGRVVSGKSLRKLTLDTEKAIHDRYVAGEPSKALAEAFGISRQAVTEAVRRYKAVRVEVGTGAASEAGRNDDEHAESSREQRS
jgi:DNA invertase Pin-like site-specific DNA recombinase